MEKGKVVGAMFALLLIGFFAGYAVAQGSVTASLRLNTSTGNMAFDTGLYAPRVITDELEFNGGMRVYHVFDTTTAKNILYFAFPSGTIGITYSSFDEAAYCASLQAAGVSILPDFCADPSSGASYEFVAPEGTVYTFPAGILIGKDFCTQDGSVCLSSVSGGEGGTGGTTETYWKPSGSGIYYDGGIVEINGGDVVITGHDINVDNGTLTIKSTGVYSATSVTVRSNLIEVREESYPGTSSSVRIYPDSVFVPKPSGWTCVGDICYKQGGSDASPQNAASTCASIGAHLCSLAEYGHFACSLTAGYYWASDMLGNSVPGQLPNYARIHITTSYGCGWDIDNESYDSSNNPTFYCCKYVGAIYPQ